MSDQQKRLPFWRKYWVSSIGVFLLSQIIFVIFEATGWLPNYKEIDGTFLGRITESTIFTEWFTFYETPQLNLLTIFFAIFFLVPGIISLLKNAFSPKKQSNSPR